MKTGVTLLPSGKYLVRARCGGLPWLSEGKGANINRKGGGSQVKARFLGWSGGKALFRAEVGLWRFSMTRFELRHDYEVTGV
jgi:hypothetical protein